MPLRKMDNVILEPCSSPLSDGVGSLTILRSFGIAHLIRPTIVKHFIFSKNASIACLFYYHSAHHEGTKTELSIQTLHRAYQKHFHHTESFTSMERQPSYIYSHNPHFKWYNSYCIWCNMRTDN